MAKKKFKDRKIGKFLKEHAPDILNEISDVVPDLGALKILSKIIDKRSAMSDDKIKEAQNLIKLESIKIKEDPMNTPKDILKSKKFWYAVAGIISMFVATKVNLPEEQLTEIIISIAVIFAALIGGQGLADAGKEAQKIRYELGKSEEERELSSNT